MDIAAIDNLEGSNRVNSLSNQEKTDLRNIDIQALKKAKDKLYYKEVKIGGGKTRQLGSIVECMKLKDGVAIDSWRGTETPISWKSEAGALIQVYLIAHNKMDAGPRNREIDGMVGPKTFQFLKSHVDVQEAQRQRDAERGRELRERAPKARFAYDYLKKNIFGKNLKGYFPTNEEARRDGGGDASWYLEAYKERFHKTTDGPKFVIDSDSRLEQGTGKIHLEFDPFGSNQIFDKRVVPGWEFVDKNRDGSYRFNEGKFKKMVKMCIAKSVVKRNNSLG